MAQTTVNLKFKKLNNMSTAPTRERDTDAGIDLYSSVRIKIPAGNREAVSTGYAVAIPEGYEINVRARSGLSLKYPNYIAISGGGTIDSDYRGEIIVPVVNHTADVWLIKRGDRIAQCIVSPIKQCELTLMDELPETERGEGGFGSTGLGDI
jgi:dUTP pyrophosphatase